MMDDNRVALMKIDGIYDIQPPLSAAFSPLETSLVIIAGTLTFCVALYALWNNYFSTKAQAKHNIKKLHIDFLKNKINSHDAAYQLIFFLQQGIQVNHIGNSTPFPKTLYAKKAEWNVFINDISTLRYKKTINPGPDINTLITNSLQWIKLWP